MNAMFLVPLDSEGKPEKDFCAVCNTIQEENVYFVAGTIEVVMCANCVHDAGAAILEVRAMLADSRA